MRLKILSVVLVLAALVSVPATASAQTIQATGQIIVVTAKVENKIFVAVDGAGRITQIFSNSDTSVAPTFVANSLNGPTIPANASLLTAYDSLIKDRPIVYGTLYERGQPIAPQLSILISQSTATINAWPNR